MNKKRFITCVEAAKENMVFQKERNRYFTNLHLPVLNPLARNGITSYKKLTKTKNFSCSSTPTLKEGVEETSLEITNKFNFNFSKKELKKFTKVLNQEKGSILGKLKSILVYDQEFSNFKIGEKRVCYKVLDVEISSKQLLIGIYLPCSKTYISLYVDDSSDESDIAGLKETVMLILNNSLTSTLDDEFLHILLTFNGDAFDLRILNFLLSEEFNIPKVQTYASCLISDKPWSEKFGENIKWGFIKNLFTKKESPFSSKLIHLDVFKLAQVPKNIVKTSALNSFKIQNWIRMEKNKSNEQFLLKTPLDLFYSSEIPKYDSPCEFMELWVIYNLNDLIHTFETFVSKNGPDFVYTRIAFKQNMAISKSLAELVRLTNPQLGLVLPGGEFLIPEDWKQKGKKVVYKNLIFINNFPKVENLYKKIFSTTQYYPVTKDNSENFSEIKVPNSMDKITFSKGGLHSKTKEKVCCFDTTDSEFIVFDLDLQSFYTVILIKIALLNDSLKALGETLQKLNSERVFLKKSNPVLSGIYKIIILSITGNLNQTLSPNIFTCPLLYYSMTANGQLLLSEFIFQMAEDKKILEDLIFANTDGTCIKIRRENEPILNGLIDQFQNKYGFEFDTKTSIKKGILFHVNHYIFLTENDEFITKGFAEGSFSFVRVLLEDIISSNKIETFGDINEMVIRKTFKKFYEKFAENPFELFYHLLGYDTFKGDKAFYFFSKTPTNSNGIVLNGNVYSQTYPTKIFNVGESVSSILEQKMGEFSNMEQVFYQNLFNDLDFLSYLKYFIKFINGYRKDREGLSEISITLQDTKEVFGENFYSQNSILRVAKNLSELGIFVFPKKPDKKNFTKLPQIVGSKGESVKINKINSLDSQNNFQNSLNVYFTTWLEATTICVLNFPSYPFIVLDFDNVQFLFESGAPSKLVNFLNLLLKWKDDGCVVYSSPTTQGILKFKILLKVENAENHGQFLKSLKTLQDFGIPVGYELLGSVFGSHFKTFNLKNPKGFLAVGNLNLSEDISYITTQSTEDFIYQELLLKFLEILTDKESKNLEKVFDSTRKDFKPLSEISNELGISLEILKGLQQESLVRKKFLLNEFLTSNFSLGDLEEIPMTPIDSKEVTLINFPKIENFSTLSLKLQKRILEAESSQSQQIFEKASKIQKMILSSNSAITLEDNSLQKITLSLNNLLIIKDLVIFCKTEFGLNFRFKDFDIDLDAEIPEIPESLTQTQLETIELVSNCIHLPSDTDNRVVTMFVNPLNISINCYHESPCKEGNLYREITSTVNSLYVGLRLINYTKPFQNVNLPTEDFFTYLCFKPKNSM